MFFKHIPLEYENYKWAECVFFKYIPLEYKNYKWAECVFFKYIPLEYKIISKQNPYFLFTYSLDSFSPF